MQKACRVFDKVNKYLDKNDFTDKKESMAEL